MLETRIIVLSSALSCVLIVANSKIAPPTDASPADAKLQLKAAVVLTPTLCLRIDRPTFVDNFSTGKIFCEKVSPALEGTFSSLDRISDPSSPGQAQVVLLPRIVSVSRTQKTFHYMADIVIEVEWTAKDSSGKMVWIETVQGHANDKEKLNIGADDKAYEHKQHYASPYDKVVDRVFRAAMQDLVEQSASKMSASPELRRLAQQNPGSDK